MMTAVRVRSGLRFTLEAASADDIVSMDEYGPGRLAAPLF
jgi:hypothetical protein